MTHRIERGPGWELHLCDYRDLVRAGFTCDAVLSDTPYSAVTHKGHDSGAATANKKQKATHARPSDGVTVTTHKRRTLGYEPWTAADVRECVDLLAPITRGWIVGVTDHVLEREWNAAMAAHGRYVFDFPTPWVAPGSRVRMTGDGPACWTCPIVQSRPSCIPYSKWGALPGSYVFTSDRGAHGGNEGEVVGAKPLALGLALIDDYTSEGDVVFDPTTGGGTFVLAAAMRGRLGVGCERDPATFELALARLRRGYTASLFSAPARMEQTGLSFPVEPEPAYEPIDRVPERPEYTDDELCAIEMVSRMEARA